MDAGSCSRQLHAAEGLDLENRAKLCSSSSLPSSLRKTSIRFCVDAFDDSTLFAMFGGRSRVFLPCPPDAYAEPPGWLVWSLRSGRMAARVVYCLDAGLGAPGCKVAKLSACDHTRARGLIHQSYSTLRQIQRCKRLHCDPNKPKIAPAGAAISHWSARR